MLKLSAIGLLLAAIYLAEVADARSHNQHQVHFDDRSMDIPENETTAEFWKNKAQDSLKDHLKRKMYEGKAKNVIMFLGDGMSIPTIAAARAYLGQTNNLTGESSKLSFENFPFTGLSKTYCVDRQVADSACSATAYLCGVKGNIGTIGVSAKVQESDCEAMADTANHVSSIVKWSQDANKATGIVTTTRVTHASPSGAYAHTANRDWENDDLVEGDPSVCADIATQLITHDPGNKLKVILGGGRKHFLPVDVVDEEGAKGKRKDGKNLIELWKTERAKLGKATYVWNKAQLNAVLPNNTDYLLGLFESDHCQYNLDTISQGAQDTEPNLGLMVHHAMQILSKEPNGYFLFVEGGRIDHGHHENLAKKALDETVQFASAINMAAMMSKPSETLIVVTSDHAHTMSYSGYPARGNDILGVTGTTADDGLPMATISYANGNGYNKHVSKAGGRVNLTGTDMSDNDFLFPATVPLSSETHGGDDVAIFAQGPWAHLFTGTLEQNLIPHIMAFASCVGDGETACNTKERSSAVSSYGASLVGLLASTLALLYPRLLA